MNSSSEHNQSLFPDVSKLNETPIIVPEIYPTWTRHSEVQHRTIDKEQIKTGLGIIATGTELPVTAPVDDEIETDVIIIKSSN